MINAVRLNIASDVIEREVVRRLERCGNGPAGLSTGPVLSNGHGEVIYRNAEGDAIGALGFCDGVIEDYCVARRARRFGIATLMADHARRLYGVRTVSGPFTPDGFAFAAAWTNGKA